MEAGRTALQAARILVLLALLRATGWYVASVTQAVTRLQTDGLWGPWAGVSIVSVLFVVVMLMGRRRWHPWVVLAVEAVIAAVLAFVPPVQWVIWFGIGVWSDTLVLGVVQPLAVAWLGVVVLRGFHQLRDASGAGPGSPDGGAGSSDAPVRRSHASSS